MERYFKVTEKSPLYKDWFDFKENSKAVNKLVNEFMKEHDIESNEYYVDNKSFYIVPTDKDAERFNSVLCSPINDGLRKFKTASKVGKAWAKALKNADLKVQRKPMVMLYFKGFGGGRFRSRLFDQDRILYCSIDPANGEPQEGFEEMKASEFFKIIEESEKESA